jgi:high-affinity K+ transport system ATPase subunit B
LGFSKVSTYIPFEKLDFYKLSTPVTNTVSAMFYKTDILSQLIPILKSYLKYKIIPIDHKLNMAFVELGKVKESNIHSLTYLSPGLFIQGSIHGD